MRKLAAAGFLSLAMGALGAWHLQSQGSSGPRCSSAICPLPYRHEVCFDGPCYWTNKDGYPIGTPITAPPTTIVD